MSRRPILLAVAGGLLLAAATPPWGFWPLTFAGLVLLERVTLSGTRRQRLVQAWVLWAALLFPSLWWMKDLTLPGYVIACAWYAGFLATGTVAAPTGPGRFLAIPAGIVAAEWVRWRWPFGGVPLSNIGVAQVGGPLAPTLRLGGALFLVLVTALAGMGLAAGLRRHARAGWTIFAVVIVTVLVAVEAPSGTGTGEMVDVALVQGGGPQGTRATDTDERVVTARHLAASETIDAGAHDLVLWPEDVVDVSRFSGSPEEAALVDLAVRTQATVVVGVIEDDGPEHFRNWAVAIGPDGEEVGRFEKVERVPFGEWVPSRSFLESMVGPDVLPARDARVGTGPAVIDTAVGRAGLVISWEVFFGERARDAVTHGAEVILNPTNGSSFRGTQVQTQQVANSRMRAIETGRWVLQAAPTGFSAVVDPDGRVLQRSAVSERRVLTGTVELRTGETIYARVGDYLALAAAAVLFGAGWLVERRRWWT